MEKRLLVNLVCCLAALVAITDVHSPSFRHPWGDAARAGESWCAPRHSLAILVHQSKLGDNTACSPLAHRLLTACSPLARRVLAPQITCSLLRRQPQRRAAQPGARLRPGGLRPPARDHGRALRGGADRGRAAWGSGAGAPGARWALPLSLPQAAPQGDGLAGVGLGGDPHLPAFFGLLFRRRRPTQLRCAHLASTHHLCHKPCPNLQKKLLTTAVF
jgi:hypothetical protein